MYITRLVIETSNKYCACALVHQGAYYSQYALVGNKHSNFLHQQISQLLNDANISMTDIDQVLVGNGPGMFTGIRVGVGFAQGLSLGIDKPCIAYSSLISMAAEVFSTQENNTAILSFIDARMGEVYAQWFVKTNNVLSALTVPSLFNFDSNSDAFYQQIKLLSLDNVDSLVVLGDGVDLLDDRNAFLERLKAETTIKKIQLNSNAFPSALPLLKSVSEEYYLTDNDLQCSVVGNNATPNYVRNDVAY